MIIDVVYVAAYKKRCLQTTIKLVKDIKRLFVIKTAHKLTVSCCRELWKRNEVSLNSVSYGKKQWNCLKGQLKTSIVW